MCQVVHRPVFCETVLPLGSTAKANPVHDAYPAPPARMWIRAYRSFVCPNTRAVRRLRDTMIACLARDHDNSLRVFSDPKFCVIKEAIYNVEMAFDTIVDQVGFTVPIANE